MNHPMPADENERLKALAALGLLEGGAPAEWNRLSRAARSRFGVPFAAVTLLAKDEQHIPAACGFAPGRTPREQAFCNWTVMHDEVFVVPDALAHRELSRNPFVSGEPGIRFYAGAPLVMANGVRLGALCVIDTRPRDFSPADAAVLRHLARMAVDEIWLSSLEGGLLFEPAPGEAPPLPTRLTVEQIRGGRGMLGWSVDRLATAAGVSAATVKRAEAPERHSGIRDWYIDRMRHAMEEAGLEFQFTPGAAPGLRPQAVRSAAP
jgi:hypothetical protein